jgi:hypothetical protein
VTGPGSVTSGSVGAAGRRVPRPRITAARHALALGFRMSMIVAVGARVWFLR